MTDKRHSSRRQFLRGAAGFTLALPFLESLVRTRAFAGEAPYARNPRFVCMTTQHGGVWGTNMFPADAMAPSQHTLYPGHVMHHGALSLSQGGATASLSPALTASSARFTPALASKMNVIRGLDVAFYLGHHTGGDLGNYARNDGNPSTDGFRPTIDQVMAYSSSFYPDLSTVRARSMHVGTHPDHCWGYSNPTQKSGDIIPVPLSQSSVALFNQIFVPEETDPNPRPLVVDKVLESYNRLRGGAFGDAARLGARDRQRLDDHMDRLRDLQTRLNAVASCGDVQPPVEGTNGLDVGGYSTNLEDKRRYYELYNDVIVAAFICGTSRIAVINSGETWSTSHSGLCCDWHQIVAHNADKPEIPEAQATMLAAQRLFFESVFIDLVSKLDVEEANGVSYLDNSLVFWTQESGSTTHNPQSLPVVTAGSAAGVLATGQYLDYRNRQNLAIANTDYYPEYALARPGILYNRWLATVLRAVNVQPDEFEHPGERGYGLLTNENPQAWPSRVFDDASEMLPLLAAG